MVFSQEGIFNRAEQGAEKYGEAKARETLELALGEAQMQKYEEGLTDEQLTEKINTIGEELPKEKLEHPELQNVIVDGHIFEIDRSVPKIVDYIGPADGVIITASVNGNKNDWFKQGENVNVTVTGRIKTYSGGTITSVNATKGGTAITDFSIDEEGRYTIDNITADTTITINATDSNGESNTKIIPITIRIDSIAPTLSEVTATVEANRIKIKAIATDNESGLRHINYSVQPTTVNSATGQLTSGQEITLIATENNEYTITFTAEDNAGNISGVQTKKVETLGVIKYIKTSEGLKGVNTVDVYGSDVLGYDCTRTGVEWQIFYIDEEDDHRVYLIAKDYMAPPVKNKTPQLISGGEFSYPKAYKFGTSTSDTTILEKFTEKIPETQFTNKFLSDLAGKDAQYPSWQATNYMINQEIWSEYMSTSGKSDYAFGGPTLPLFQASYNDTCRSATRLGIQYSGTGYQVKLGTGGWTTTQTGYGNTSTQKGIYFKGNTSNSALGMWFASPSALNDGKSVMESRCEGTGIIGCNYYDIYLLGFRPIISLKSNIQFTDNGNGTYTIN